jgi:hypothetical protein
MSKVIPTEQRFWSKVNKDAPNGCWEWTASLTHDGYGVFQVREVNHWRFAHRVSYQMAHGDIPDGVLICHSCDNRKCVNPDHLFAGTPKDNTQDMIRKGRKYLPIGESNRGSKLNTASVIEIRNLSQQGIRYPKIAKQFSVSVSVICEIVKRKAWRHVP